MSFADPEDGDERWLQEPKIDSPVRNWRNPAPERPQRQPSRLRVGNTKKLCNHCGEKAAVELFRDGKCLACQAADFLGPL